MKFKVCDTHFPAAWVGVEGLNLLRLDSRYYSPQYLKDDELLNSELFEKKNIGQMAALVKDGPGGWAFKANEYTTAGVPVIRASDLVHGLDLSNAVYMTEEKHQELKQSECLPGDLVISVRGTTGRAAIIPNSVKKANLNAAVVRVRLKEKWLKSGQFITAFLNSSFGRRVTERIANGAVQNNINLTEVRSIPVPIPDSRIQDYIGLKVELAEKCREEANKLHRKMNEKVDEFLSQLGIPKIQDKETDQLTFFAESDELTNIRLDPKYYRPRFIFTVKNLTSVKHDFLENIITNCNYGASVPSDYVDEGIPFIRGVDLVENRILSGDICYLSSLLSNKVKRSRVNKNDILITRSGSVGTTSVVTEKYDGYAFGSYMIRFSVNSNYNPFYIASFLNSPYGKSQTERLRNGAVQENINLEEIGRIVIPWISREAQDEVERLVRLWIDFSEKSIGFNTEAKSDVEALIEGKLDTDAIMSGKLKSPTWENIEKELEGI